MSAEIPKPWIWTSCDLKTTFFYVCNHSSSDSYSSLFYCLWNELLRFSANLISWTLILLNIPVEIQGNHYQWWTCSAECRRCIRRTTPLEKWISEYYSGLFSRKPPEAFYDSTQANPVKNPSNPNNTGPPGTTENPSNTGVPHQYGCCET